MMKRNTIWGLAITLVLGCWVGSASARPLPAWDALLLPYYEAKGDLATIIGVQHVAAVPGGAGASIINVAVYDGEDRVVEDLGFICLAQDEFGFVVIQSSTPTARDTHRGIYFSVEEDMIPETGFVTLAYAGTRSSCGSGGGSPAADDAAARKVMVAWTILQDIGTGFFATEIPMLQVPWIASVSNAKPAKGLEPYCYLKTDPSNNRIPLSGSTGVFNTDKTACANPETHTFVASGPYCYANTDDARAIVVNENIIQLNDTKNGCKETFTHTFVPANTTLPAIPAVGPGASFACESDASCPGLARTAGTPPLIGARFDVTSFNNSVSNIYLWLSTAPPDGRKTTNGVLDVVCEDGTMQTLTASQLDRIDISGSVTRINPSGLGCSGRGVLELTLPRRAADQAVEEKCYDPADSDQTAVPQALDADNNRCRRFTYNSNLDFNSDTTDDAGCYDSSISYVLTRDINRNGVTGEDGDTGCIQKGTSGPRVTGVETPNSTNPTGCRSRSITRVEQAEPADVATSRRCKSFKYAPDMTSDTPNGYMFSHISQANAHFRMNFPGYTQ